MVDLKTILFIVCLSLCITSCESTFTFASSYSDHVVLQKGTRGTIVWGKSSKLGDTVHVSLNGHEVAHSNVTHDAYGGLIWMVKVVMTSHHYGPYNLTARSSLGAITLHDVMFGDVWLCSGQSNMEFTLSKLINDTSEYADASNYQDIRVFKANHYHSSSSLGDFHPHTIASWAKPSRSSLTSFSAVCWLFGKRLSSQFGYPIGLIESNFGGTKIELWSSPDALSQCSSRKRANNIANSGLWNGMISPLLRNTIYGTIWYQGESNTPNPGKYACQFPAMIADWRHKFSDASLHTTSPSFPFGFVQLAGNHNGTNGTYFAWMRWTQTAAYGKVPNAKMPNTFMAVAMDLPDFKSPYGTIHPRFKHDVASRLALSALGVAYHQSGLEYQGPYPSNYHVTGHSLNIEYDQGRTPIRVNANVTNFEVCCSYRECNLNYGVWQPAPITSHDVSSITLDTSPCGHVPLSAVRYAWRESPCAFKECA
ncbi:sialate O-acetylesterase-like [Mizuhopecten yessoensis]|uniref:Sialate O-acetylesterase n=1 Tax=Mizuhopecten yessoensis TaxID=6573 RepID=A0A210Q7P2_MIZYE|nr:sialate O-acetylesterase-like [Mizuhopecten yessoensis]OWF44709.1 Sialate O-acetylesterase [Mizuhopecten yessoensis]